MVYICPRPAVPPTEEVAERQESRAPRPASSFTEPARWTRAAMDRLCLDDAKTDQGRRRSKRSEAAPCSPIKSPEARFCQPTAAWKNKLDDENGLYRIGASHCLPVCLPFSLRVTTVLTGFHCMECAASHQQVPRKKTRLVREPGSLPHSRPKDRPRLQSRGVADLRHLSRPRRSGSTPPGPDGLLCRSSAQITSKRARTRGTKQAKPFLSPLEDQLLPPLTLPSIVVKHPLVVSPRVVVGSTDSPYGSPSAGRWLRLLYSFACCT